jgi:serine/threonine protein kinase
MAANHALPFFIRAGKVVQCSASTDANNRDFHFDLLSFISIAEKLDVDFVQTTWQPALEMLGKGATSMVQQAQMDAKFGLAFKRSMAWSEEDFADTKQQEVARYKALIYELIALAVLSKHPNVIDLLGITWEIDAETEQVWPVLLTERSIYGTMADFLPSEIGTNLDCRGKLKLCADIARACQTLHKLGELSFNSLLNLMEINRHQLISLTGIVHGDIKQENVLIFRNGDAWTGKLIDFGYSCLGTSDNDMVKVACTRPWQAPEHSKDRFFQLSAARCMDVYSFGMLVCCTFLSDELSGSVGKVGYCDNLGEHMQLLEHIEMLKSSPIFLDQALEAVQFSKSIDYACKEGLSQIFKLTLQHEPQLRSADFNPIIPILSSVDVV